MKLDLLWALWEALPLRAAGVLLAALLAGLTATSVLSRLRVSLAGGDQQALATFLAADRTPDPVERLGAWLLGRLPTLRTLLEARLNRRWLLLRGEAPSHATIVGWALLLGLGGLLPAVLIGVPIASLLAVMGAAFPFVRLRREAQSVRRAVQRALPELSALMAAEMAAGNPPDKALERAAEWGGPLSVLMGRVVDRSRATGRPVFGRGDLPGVLSEVVTEYDLAALRAFASQIDLAARKGAAGPELMQGLARTLIIEYKDHALRQAEALEHRLAVPSVLFFFLPFLFLVLAPLLLPLLSIL
jgi:Flp pilus assembly protein TadB